MAQKTIPVDGIHSKSRDGYFPMESVISLKGDFEGNMLLPEKDKLRFQQLQGRMDSLFTAISTIQLHLQMDNSSIQILTYDLQLHILLSRISMRALVHLGGSDWLRQRSLVEVQISMSFDFVHNRSSSVLKAKKVWYNYSKEKVLSGCSSVGSISFPS